MNQDINMISINDDFWIQLLDGRISFRFKGLPKDIHLTVSFHPDRPDINFHVTREINVPDKPQIKVVLIDKELLKQLETPIGISFFSAMIEPLPLKPYHLNSNKSAYVPFDALNYKPVQKKFETHFKKAFHSVARVKGKKKFKLEGDIEQPFESMISSIGITKTDI